MGDSTDGPESTAFQPAIHMVKLDAEVRSRREEFDRDLKVTNSGWATHAAPRLAVCQYVIDKLAHFHSEVVDQTDIDLSAQTRWVAILESTSRCISLADALVDQLRRGYASETAGTARVLHEALQLAVALAGGDEEQAKRWLRGKQYPSKRAAAERTDFFRRLLMDSTREAELEAALAVHIAEVEKEVGRPIVDGADAVDVIARRLYGELSAGAHNLRKAFADGIAVPLRRFTYGRHPLGGVRSYWIELAEALIEQACLDVSACMAEIVGVDAVRETTLLLTTQLQEVREKYSFY